MLPYKFPRKSECFATRKKKKRQKTRGQISIRVEFQNISTSQVPAESVFLKNSKLVASHHFRVDNVKYSLTMAREPGGLCTTRCQLFNNEITKTENILRMKWFVKNRQRLLDNLGDDRLVNRARKIREKYEDERIKRRKEEETEILEEDKKLPAWRLPKSDGSVNLDIMKPTDPSVRAILYESGVKSYTTGNNYLHERYKEKPENRFYYPDCTSWLHGWRLTDHPPVQATKYGKSSIIRETFYRRNGPSLKHDDDSGRSCQTSNSKDFNDILTY